VPRASSVAADPEEPQLVVRQDTAPHARKNKGPAKLESCREIDIDGKMGRALENGSSNGKLFR